MTQNIPVNIFIHDPNDKYPDYADGKWHLTADNFMPRKSYCSDYPYHTTADTREELVELLSKCVRPLYETAISIIDAMISGEKDAFYYWNKK